MATSTVADYVPIIAPAVARLTTNDAPNRQALYQHARAALREQLRDVISGAELVREQANLETAIRKVEAQYAPTPKATPQGVKPIAPLPRLFPRSDKPS
jgi:hypothetical protein